MIKQVAVEVEEKKDNKLKIEIMTGPFKMKGFSGFGNSPAKDKGHDPEREGEHEHSETDPAAMAGSVNASGDKVMDASGNWVPKKKDSPAQHPHPNEKVAHGTYGHNTNTGKSVAEGGKKPDPIEKSPNKSNMQLDVTGNGSPKSPYLPTETIGLDDRGMGKANLIDTAKKSPNKGNMQTEDISNGASGRRNVGDLPTGD